MSDPQTPESAVPKGAIIAWYAKAGGFPSGWAICDGASDLASVGTFVGLPDHKHVMTGSGEGSGNGAISGTCSGQTENCQAHPDGYWWDADISRERTPQASGLDHYHVFNGTVGGSAHVSVNVSVSGLSDTKSNIPPAVIIVYLMKV